MWRWCYREQTSLRSATGVFQSPKGGWRRMGRGWGVCVGEREREREREKMEVRISRGKRQDVWCAIWTARGNDIEWRNSKCSIEYSGTWAPKKAPEPSTNLPPEPYILQKTGTFSLVSTSLCFETYLRIRCTAVERHTEKLSNQYTNKNKKKRRRYTNNSHSDVSPSHNTLNYNLRAVKRSDQYASNTANEEPLCKVIAYEITWNKPNSKVRVPHCLEGVTLLSLVSKVVAY